MKNISSISWLTILLFACGCMFISACNPAEQANSDPDKQNIVLMFTDELQFSDIGVYGGNFPTPTIDQLANQGIKFEHAYTTASMCTPSRFSVLTGLYPGRCQAKTFLTANPTDQPYNIAWNTWITPGLATLPRVLSKHGYTTGMSGKWHVGHLPDSVQVPELNAHDDLNDPVIENKLRARQASYEAQVRSDAGFDYVSSILWENFDNHPIEALRFHNFPWITKGALDFLDKQKSNEKPFFLYVTPTAIHGPNHVEDLDKDKAYTPEGKQPEVLQYNLDEEDLKDKLKTVSPQDAHRYAGITNIDHQLRLIRQKLAEIGKADNTMIIFMSDHNIEPGKATSYEKGIHIPMIIYWPGKTSGQSSATLLSSIDLFPTILEIAGIPGDGLNLDGHSFLNALQNPEQQSRHYVFSENGYTRSVSDGRYKYIALRYPDQLIQAMQQDEVDHAPSYVGRWPQAHSAIAIHSFPHYFDQDQLYDLHSDPYEQENIFADQAEIAIQLKQALANHLANFKHPFDLDEISYLNSEDYREKCRVNQAYDLSNIPWYRRDHGEISWPK